MTGRFHSAAPISATSICGDILETFNCISVAKTEKRAGDSGDGIWEQRSSASSYFSVLDLLARGELFSFLVGWYQTFLAGNQIGLGFSCGKTQAKPLPVVRKRSDPFKIPSKGSHHCNRKAGVNFGVCQWREIEGCLEFHRC